MAAESRSTMTLMEKHLNSDHADRPGENADGLGESVEPGPNDADPYERARTICLTQLSFAPRSRAHLEGVLHKRNIPEQIAAAVLDRLTEVGLVNDAEYAQMWVRSRHRTKGLSRRVLREELRRAGICDDLVTEALTQVDDDSERAAACALVLKKYRASADRDSQVRRLVAMLARKGYPANTCFDVVKEVLADQSSM